MPRRPNVPKTFWFICAACSDARVETVWSIDVVSALRRRFVTSAEHVSCRRCGDAHPRQLDTLRQRLPLVYGTFRGNAHHIFLPPMD